MNNFQNSGLKKNFHDHTDEIDLKVLLDVIFKEKWTIVSITAFISILGVLYSLYLPNLYQTKALLDPVDSSSSISGTLGGLSSLAGIAGVSLPSSSSEGNSSKALEKLNSLSFFKNNILPNIFLPDLMALKSWDPKTNTLVYDENLYLKDSDTWIRRSSNSNKQMPTAQESFKQFLTHFELIADKLSGFVTLKIKHQSPYVAKEWAELMINQVNSFYRQKDKSESKKSLDYLNQQIAKTSLSEVKEAIAELLQQETKKLTLIESKEFYVFEYIDPPAIMEVKSEPRRSLICIIASIFGGMLSILFVLLRHRYKNVS